MTDCDEANQLQYRGCAVRYVQPARNGVALEHPGARGSTGGRSRRRGDQPAFVEIEIARNRPDIYLINCASRRVGSFDAEINRPLLVSNLRLADVAKIFATLAEVLKWQAERE